LLGGRLRHGDLPRHAQRLEHPEDLVDRLRRVLARRETQPIQAEAVESGVIRAQLGVDLVVCLIAAWVVGQGAPAVPNYITRVCLVSALGLLASVFVDVPYWNWYCFPAHYTLMAIVDRTVGMTVAGLVIARFVKS